MQLLTFYVRGRFWVATESRYLWSGVLHITHYYRHYYYLCIHRHTLTQQKWYFQTWTQLFLLGVPSSFPVKLLATNTLLLVSTVLCVFILFDCSMVPIGMRHHGSQLCLLPHVPQVPTFEMAVFKTEVTLSTLATNNWAGPVKFDPGQVKIIIDYIRREIFWTFLGD